MSFASSRSLFDQQLELIRIVVGLRHGMADHLRRRVLPHLDPDAREGVENAIDFLDEHDDIGINLLCFVDIALTEVREAIAAGTSERRVPIPPERLIGTSEAYDVHRVLSPQAEALTAALLPIEELAKAANQLVQFAEAVRLSADIVNLT